MRTRAVQDAGASELSVGASGSSHVRRLINQTFDYKGKDSSLESNKFKQLRFRSPGRLGSWGHEARLRGELKRECERGVVIRQQSTCEKCGAPESVAEAVNLRGCWPTRSVRSPRRRLLAFGFAAGGEKPR